MSDGQFIPVGTEPHRSAVEPQTQKLPMGKRVGLLENRVVTANNSIEELYSRIGNLESQVSAIIEALEAD